MDYLINLIYVAFNSATVNEDGSTTLNFWVVDRDGGSQVGPDIIITIGAEDADPTFASLQESVNAGATASVISAYGTFLNYIQGGSPSDASEIRPLSMEQKAKVRTPFSKSAI